MKVLIVTQGNNLKVATKILQAMQFLTEKLEVGAFICDSRVFASWSPPEFINQKFIVKEWDLYKDINLKKIDEKLLNEYELEIGDPTLWNAVIADRRVFMGKHCKYTQDYSSKFSNTEKKIILQEHLKSIDKLIIEFQPDLVLGFGSSTISDYLAYRFAKARSISYLLLKATKIENYISLNDDMIQPSTHLVDRFNTPETISEESRKVAESYKQKVNESGLIYEGVLSDSSGQSAYVSNLYFIIRAFVQKMKILITNQEYDPQAIDSFALNVYQRIINPLRWNKTLKTFNDKLVDIENSDGKFIFYPMHYEPEVSLQVFGRAFQNQIELVRYISQSLPIGYSLIFKEHPRSKGMRPVSYYKSLFELPNVKMAPINMPTNFIVQKSELVIGVSGSTCLEAAILGKKSLVLGTPAYASFDSMGIELVENYSNLSKVITSVLKNPVCDNSKLMQYMSSVVESSVPVNLYTDLLAKPGRVSLNDGVKVDVDKQYSLLADYLLKRAIELGVDKRLQLGG
ncbi:hypothetical protein [Aliamphritea ceti]|uniref:hypothetical protein n=1 Tax=Aliamphritea ceti TaxID=1524258 RepID=UPI0021C38242|nr:hypothetical protein [Aliamphritea ceti]